MKTNLNIKSTSKNEDDPKSKDVLKTEDNLKK